MERRIKEYNHSVEKFKEFYFTDIKPLIEMGSYDLAGAYLENVKISLKRQREGLEFKDNQDSLSRLDLLVLIDNFNKKLKNREFDSKKDFKDFEERLK